MNATMVASGTKAVPPPVSSIQDIPIAKIRESKTNPRRFFDEAKLAELAENIRQHGVLQPVLVRPLPEREAGTYELVAGTRRYRASKLAKRESIPATVRELTDAQALELQVIENVQRVDVHPLDEAQGYAALIELQPDTYTVESIAARVGRSPAYVNGRLRLIQLIPEAKQAFYEAKLMVAHAFEISRLQPLCSVRDYVVFNARGPVITTLLRSGEHISHLRPGRCDEKRSESLLRAHQVEDSDFRSGAEPDGETGNPDAAVHVELRATFFVPDPDVGYPYQAAEVEPAVHEIERHLAAAVNVAGQRQIDTQIGMMIEEMRVVGEQNVNGIRHHQRFELLQSPVALYLLRMHRGHIAPVVYPNQINRIVTQPDRCALLAQHVNTLGGEQTSDALFNPHFRFVVSHTSENAVRRSQARQHTNHLTLGFRVPTNVVPGQRDQVWF